MDEMTSAYSVGFDHAGGKIYAGLKNEVRIFDISVPGKFSESRKTWVKKEVGGQKGIISSIAVTTSHYTIFDDT